MPENHHESAREQERRWDVPPADWVLDMQDHYRKWGWYRPEDLRRLLGDPSRHAGWHMETNLAVRNEEIDREER